MTGQVVDIVIVSFNTSALLRDCLESIREYGGDLVATTTVVDNNSQDGSPEVVAAEFPWVNLIRNAVNTGFSAANNAGFKTGDAPLILYQNSDAMLTAGALEALVDCMSSAGSIVIAGPRLVFPDGTFQRSCRRFPTLWRNLWTFAGGTRRWPGRFRSWDTWLNEEEHARASEIDMVSGACFLARRAYIESLGGMDENLFFYEEEFDLSLPARRQGMVVRYSSASTVIHHGGASVSANDMNAFSTLHLFRSKYYAFRKHYGAWYCHLTHWCDLGLFSFSRLLNYLRNKETPATLLYRSCRRGYHASFSSPER